MLNTEKTKDPAEKMDPNELDQYTTDCRKHVCHIVCCDCVKELKVEGISEEDFQESKAWIHQSSQGRCGRCNGCMCHNPHKPKADRKCYMKSYNTGLPLAH